MKAPLLTFLICFSLLGCDSEESPKLEYADSPDAYYPFVDRNELVGYLNREGRVVIPGRYDLGTRFHNGVARVLQGDLMTLIDSRGPLFPPTHAVVGELHEGLAVAGDDEEGFGYINRTGAWVIPPTYDRAFDFSDGRAMVLVDDRFGYINRKGEMVIPPAFADALFFASGRAVVRKERGDRYFLIDRNGERVSRNDFEMVFYFTEGLAAAREDNKWGFIGVDGEWRIPPTWASAHVFSEGLARVMDDQHNEFYIDMSGNIVLRNSSNFDFANAFSNGLVPVSQSVKGRELWGYMDKSGCVVIPFQFDDARSFIEGIAPVAQGDVEGYIDVTGRWIWKDPRHE